MLNIPDFCMQCFSPCRDFLTYAKHISSGVLSYVSSLSFLLFFLLFCLSHPAAISSHPTRHVPSGDHKKTTSSFRRFYVHPHRRCKTRQDQNLNHSKTEPQQFDQLVLIMGITFQPLVVCLCPLQWNVVHFSKQFYIFAGHCTRSRTSCREEVLASSNCFVVCFLL